MADATDEGGGPAMYALSANGTIQIAKHVGVTEWNDQRGARVPFELTCDP